MATQQTLSIIKPDGVRRNLIGKVISRFESNGIQIAAAKLIHMDRRVAEGFYAVHRERPFFESLITFMTSGPCMVMVLQGEDVIARNREIMGATDPAKAAEGTIRKDFAENIEANTVHGSDSPENAAIEIAWFFAGTEQVHAV